MTFSNSLPSSASIKGDVEGILPVSKSAYAFFQGPSSLKCGIHQEPDVQLGERMLNQCSNVVWESAKSCVPTLSDQQMIEDIIDVELTLKP